MKKKHSYFNALAEAIHRKKESVKTDKSGEQRPDANHASKKKRYVKREE